MKHKVIFPALALLLLCGASLFSACHKEDLPPRLSGLKIEEKATKTNLGEIFFAGNPTTTPYAEITYESPGIFSKVIINNWVEIRKLEPVGDENIYVFKRIGDRNKDKKLQIQISLWADIPYHEPVRVE